jgi:hypothetical protein
MTDPAININTVIFIVSDNIKIVISFGINPVNGGNPPRDRRRVAMARCSIRLFEEILFICLEE